MSGPQSFEERLKQTKSFPSHLERDPESSCPLHGAVRACWLGPPSPPAQGRPTGTLCTQQAREMRSTGKQVHEAPGDSLLAVREEELEFKVKAAGSFSPEGQSCSSPFPGCLTRFSSLTAQVTTPTRCLNVPNCRRKRTGDLENPWKIPWGSTHPVSHGMSISHQHP